MVSGHFHVYAVLIYVILTGFDDKTLGVKTIVKVKVGNEQEMAQSERN